MADIKQDGDLIKTLRDARGVVEQQMFDVPQEPHYAELLKRLDAAIQTLHENSLADNHPDRRNVREDVCPNLKCAAPAGVGPAAYNPAKDLCTKCGYSGGRR